MIWVEAETMPILCEVVPELGIECLQDCPEIDIFDWFVHVHNGQHHFCYHSDICAAQSGVVYGC